MKTRCPHCKFVYDIKESTLADADFKVVCSDCHHIFQVKSIPTAGAQEDEPIDDADENIPSFVDELQRTLDQLDEKTNEGIPRAVSQQDQEILEELDRSLDDIIENKPVSPIPRPPMETAPQQPVRPPEPLSLDEIPSVEPQPVAFPSRKRKTSGLAMAAAAVLAIAAVAQIAWIERDQLGQYPEFRQAVAAICPYLGCRIPEASPQPDFSVVDRSLFKDSQQAGAYRLEVMVRNDSHTAQPLPALQLSLLDDKQTPMARRTFAPEAYMDSAKSARKRLAPGELLEIRLRLKTDTDPVSGFELDFIPGKSS